MTWNSGPMLSDGDRRGRIKISKLKDGRVIDVWHAAGAFAPGHEHDQLVLLDAEFDELVVLVTAVNDAVPEASLRDAHAGHDTCPSCSRCRDCGGQHKTGCEYR